MKKPIASENFKYITNTKTFFITLSELYKKTEEAINNIGLKISGEAIWFDLDSLHRDEEGKETHRIYLSSCKEYKILLIMS